MANAIWGVGFLLTGVYLGIQEVRLPSIVFGICFALHYWKCFDKPN